MTFKTVASASKTILDVTDAYTVVLSKESYTVACDKDGGAITGELGATGNAKTTISVYKGATPLNGVASSPSLNQFSYTIGTPVNCTSNRTDNISLYINSISSDSGSVPITINIEGDVTVSKIFSFAKAKTGATGSGGTNGTNGKTYTLNVTGGTRAISYDASGATPNPNTSTVFNVVLYEDGVVKTPATIAWSVNGNLNVSGVTTNIATFTPKINTTYSTGDTSVSVTVTYGTPTVTVSQTVPIASVKDASGVDWVNDWTTGATVVNGQKIIAPHIFAGQVNGDTTITGVAIGKDVLSGSTSTTVGIVQYKNNNAVFQLKNDGSLAIGQAGKDQITLDASGNAVIPNIKTDKVIVGTTGQNIYDYTNTVTKAQAIDGRNDTLFHFDNGLCSTNGLNPNGGFVTSLRRNEGKFNGSVAVEMGTTNLAVGITRYEETDGSILYSGTWSGESNASSGGTDKYSNTTGDYALFTFTGTGVRWYTLTSANIGLAKITLDNGTPTTVDNYSVSTVYQKKAYEVTNLTYGTHTIKVEVNGTKNASSTNYYVVIDAFEVLDNTVGSFENGMANWTKNGGSTSTVVDSTLNGFKKMLKITSLDTSSSNYSIKPTLLANTTYTLSFWINIVSGIDVSHTVSFGVADPSWLSGGVLTLSSSTGVWEKKVITFTTPGTITSPYLYIGYVNAITSACEIYITGVQLEQKSYATSYVSGVRSDGQLYYPPSTLNVNQFTIMGWFNPIQIHQGATGTAGINTNWYFPLIELAPTSNRGSSSTGFTLALDPDAPASYLKKLKLLSPVSGVGTTSLNNNAWYFIAVTFNGGAYNVYLNGNTTPEITVTGSTKPQLFSDSVFMVGGGYNGKANVLIDELLVSNRVYTTSEIQAIYNLQQPLYDPNPQVNPPIPANVTISFV